jgi:signal transduction histidine kinase/CheY-like chemotaxis protein/ABC-type amino acid transport substrate-binding protein
MLKTGAIDAFIYDAPVSYSYKQHDFIRIREMFPIVYTPVSLTAVNAELQPIISVMNKFISAGGIDILDKLYSEGSEQYIKYLLNTLYTKEEKAYLDSLASTGSKVRIALENDNYPIIFYDEYSKEFKGIAIDILAEISKLTGIEFQSATDELAWSELLKGLIDGNVSLASQLIYSEARKDHFLWNDKPYFTSRYALLSKSDFPNLKAHQIVRARVGIIRTSTYEHMYKRWFPDNNNIKEFDNMNEMLDALEQSEIDLAMVSENVLLALTHQREKSGFKVNLAFSSPLEKSYFGFNKNEAALQGIFNKAMPFIDTETIGDAWVNRMYDYSRKLAEERSIYYAISTVMLTLVLIFLVFVYIRDKIKSKTIIEQRIAHEDAVRASNAKSTFLATMSHEIRTPMNGIMGFAELAMDGTSEPKIKDYLGKIIDSTRWLLCIINDILDISKVESGKMELESVPFDLSDVISRCQSVILPSVKEKGLDMVFHIEPLIGKKLVGDSVRLHQVLINLLSNAVKFTSAGAIKFTSKTKKIDNGNATVYFEVKDSGIGMSPEQIKKIFDPFTQADSSTTRNYGGTGLGLAIVKKIVELMGGELTVESTLGAGSTFYFEITFQTVEISGEVPNSNGNGNSIEKPYFNGLVLVCDDNKMNQQVAYEHLARVGLNSVTANNGKEAFEMVKKRRQKGEKNFDLILMDIFMPVMDGIEAASKITALNTGTPIVAMTANVMLNELENYRKNGMLDYIGKPFTSQELWRVLLNYLTPVSSSAVDMNEQVRDTDKLLRKLQINFVSNNQSVFAKIVKAIDDGDIKLAHRLTHTLKGNAGQLGESKLQDIAREIEDLLRVGALVPENKMNLLEKELRQVLDKLQPLLDEIANYEAKSLDAEQALALFEKVKPMIENINPEVELFLDDIRAVPGTEKLTRHIKDFEFEFAAKELAELKAKISDALTLEKHEK